MKLSEGCVPSTVKSAVDTIVDALSKEDRKAIETAKKTGYGSAAIHHGYGSWLRNFWGLWKPDSPLKRDAVNTYGIAHADDISGLILAWVMSIVCDYPFDPVQECERFHEHWKRYGNMTSLQAGGWPPQKRKYRVVETDRRIVKIVYNVEADSKDEAIEIATSGEAECSETIEGDFIGDPHFEATEVTDDSTESKARADPAR